MAESADDIRAALENQLADLRKEVGKISKSLTHRANDALDEAESYYETGKDRVRQYASQVREQAHVATDAMKENPGTTATVLSTVAVVGFTLGFMLGGLMSGDRR